jgi:hypothetical protein
MNAAVINVESTPCPTVNLVTFQESFNDGAYAVRDTGGCPYLVFDF